MMDMVVLVVPWLDDNSLGRAYCLALLLEHLRVDYRVISMSGPAPIWEPLRNTPFADRCVALSENEASDRELVRQWLRDADLVISLKPLPESLGVCLRLATPGTTRLLVDVDDPDLEAGTVWRSPPRRIKAMAGSRYWDLRRMRRCVARLPVIAGNPELQRGYGGALIPHVREPTKQGAPHVSEGPTVVFVGTVRPHKGVDVLRLAIARLAGDGFRLGVTADAPPDAMPHENWYGVTSFERGLDLVQSADVVAVPSLVTPETRAQFPVKIVDALLAGRPIVASQVGPIPWAVGPGGRLVAPGDAVALAGALRRLASPSERQQLGALGMRHGRQHFVVEAVAGPFEQAMKRAPTLSEHG